MPKASKIVAGLEILIEYEHSGWCDADLDVLYGPKGANDISHDDQDKLRECGWKWDESRQRWFAYT